MKKCLIVPSDEELDYLFELIKTNIDSNYSLHNTEFSAIRHY